MRLGTWLFLGAVVLGVGAVNPSPSSAFLGDSSAAFTGLTEFGANKAHVTGHVTVDPADCETAFPDGDLREWEDGKPCGGRVVISAGQTCDYAGEVLWESDTEVLSNDAVPVDAVVDLPEWAGCVFLGYYSYIAPFESAEIADPNCLAGFAYSVRRELCRLEPIQHGDDTREMLLAQWGGVQADCRMAKQEGRRAVVRLRTTRRRNQSRRVLRPHRQALRRAALRIRRAC